MARVRVGILMEGVSCPFYLHRMIETLANDPAVDLYLIINNATATHLHRTTGSAFFRTVMAAEAWVLRPFLPSRAGARDDERPVDADLFREAVTVTPTLSADGRAMQYGGDDLAKIERLGLNLLVRGNATGNLGGGILTVAEAGLIEWHADDGPLAGFREVSERKPATEFVIRRLADNPADGTILVRSGATTQRSFTGNRAHLCRVAAGFLCQTIQQFARTGMLAPEAAAGTAQADPKMPGALGTLAYVCRTFGLYATLAVRRLLLRRRPRWSVAYTRAPWSAFSLAGATVIENPVRRFLADPFVITRDGQTVIFAEDYSYASGRGTISAVVLDETGGHTIVPNVVEEPFHLSFPFLFEYEGGLYMVPESHAAGSIRLYRCTRFPDVWAYQHDLMVGIEAADTMILQQGERWWLLANVAPPGSDSFDVQLCAFSADTPLSRDWVPHVQNPVVTSPAISRNGGFVRDVDGAVLRVRQRQGFNRYGESVSLAKIATLDGTTYEETFYREVRPDFLPNIEGTHHLHSDGRVTVFDFLREERVG